MSVSDQCWHIVEYLAWCVTSVGIWTRLISWVFQ